MIRTIKFQKVFDRVVRLLGRDPLAEIPQDMARAILDHVNERVETIHSAWDWPEWQLTEERAFRQIWNSTDQYKRASDADGQPEEVFYLGAGYVVGEGFGTNYGYYRVKASAGSDPPIGTVPTNTTYWEAMDEPIDTYIDYDQRCRRAIGRVIGVYNSNPRYNGTCHNGLCFHPSEKGIDVRGSGNATVFLTHLMPLPVYSIIPYVEGKTYDRGDVVFDPDTGECFQALSSTATAPSNTTYWRWVPFPEKWATFVVNAAFADCLSEFDQGGNDDVQAKFGIAGKAEARAMEALQARIDDLSAQGQKLKWGFCNRNIYWYETVPFTGGAVSTLTAECQDELGWVYPTPSAPAAGGVFYLPTIMSLKTTVPTLVANQPTVGYALGSMFEIYTGAQFRIDSGAANSANPGEGQPIDYNVATNNVKWVQVI